MSRLTPIRTAQLAVASSLLTLAAPILGVLNIHIARSPRLALIVSTMVLSSALTLWAIRRVRVTLAFWTDEAIGPARKWINSSWTTAILVTVGVLWIADFVEVALIPSHFLTSGTLIFPWITILDLRRQFNPKPAPIREPV